LVFQAASYLTRQAIGKGFYSTPYEIKWILGFMPWESSPMSTVKYVYWQEDDAWLGYFQDYPDYWTQGESFDDLIEHLEDLYGDLTSETF
jgi:hypothetical protein